MVEYRICKLDESGRTAQTIVINCRDDLDALEAARHTPKGMNIVKVYQGPRFVAEVEPSGDAPEAPIPRSA